MSKQWWVIFGVVLVVGGVFVVVGIRLYGWDSFREGLLSGAGVSLLVFAVAIALIEGAVMTRERRLQKVVRRACSDVVKINEEIARTLAREIGEYLGGKLDSGIDLYGDERGDWKAFKDLLRGVFEAAREVPVAGLPRSERISREDYLLYVDGAKRFMERVGNAIGSSFEVQAELVELVEGRDRLYDRIMEAGYPRSVSDEKERYVRLAAIGDAIIDLVEG